MNRDEIMRVLAENVAKVLPDVTERMVREAEQLADLGANSLDRMDIVVGTMDDLQIRVPTLEVGSAKDIDSLVSVLLRHRSSSS